MKTCTVVVILLTYYLYVFNTDRSEKIVVGNLIWNDDRKCCNGFNRERRSGLTVTTQRPHEPAFTLSTMGPMGERRWDVFDQYSIIRRFLCVYLIYSESRFSRMLLLTLASRLAPWAGDWFSPDFSRLVKTKLVPHFVSIPSDTVLCSLFIRAQRAVCCADMLCHTNTPKSVLMKSGQKKIYSEPSYCDKTLDCDKPFRNWKKKDLL